MSAQGTTAIVKRRPSAVRTTSAKRTTPKQGKIRLVSTSTMKQGTRIVAGVGAGKSRLLGRVFAWHLLLSGQAGVILDPTGGVVDNLFSKIICFTPKEQEKIWQRIRYIAPGTKEIVFPTPLYYRLDKQDMFFEIANRFPYVLKRIDPFLASAPILGWNSLHECAIHAGKIATALGEQIDFVAALVEHPGQYKAQLRQVLAQYPELKPDLDYFRALMDPSASSLREKRTGSFKNKLLPFVADPVRMATYAGKKNRLNWKKLLKQRMIVIIDYRNQLDPDHLQFDMVWHLRTFMDAIKERGVAGRGQEVTLVADEITALLGQRGQDGQALLAEDLRELVTRIGRNFGVNVLVAHQSLQQIHEDVQDVLMGMGNQLVGQLASFADAMQMARQFLRYNPYKVKKIERVWHTIHYPTTAYPVPEVIDIKTHEFTPEEQLLAWVNRILDLGRFRFYVQLATGEGGKKGAVQKLSIANLDKDQYPQEEILAPLRQALARRDGIPLAEALQALHKPLEGEPKKPKTRPAKPATLITTHANTDHLPETTPPVPAAGQQPRKEKEPDDERVFR